MQSILKHSSRHQDYLSNCLRSDFRVQGRPYMVPWFIGVGVGICGDSGMKMT